MRRAGWGRRRLIEAAVVLAALALPLVLGRLTGPKTYGTDDLEPAVARYGSTSGASCEPGSRAHPGADPAERRTPKGFRYVVRVPSNYDPTRRHPLLVVYAPAGAHARQVERFVGLTRLATEAGFIVAYVDSQRLSIPTILELGTIPAQIAREWCVDEDRVYLTGHSDGATVSTALAVLPETRGTPAAIAPSAAGLRAEDLAAYGCPAPLPVMVMHSRDDRLFPGFGREAAAWWAGCNRCRPLPADAAPAGGQPLVFSDCAAPTVYYESLGPHEQWPGLNREIIDFFRRAGPRRGG